MPNFRIDDVFELLSRTPATLHAWLVGLPDSWIRAREPNGWSPYEIVGHLIHGERTDWMPRLRRIMEHGETRAFDKFDRVAQERMDQTESINQRLETFANLRKENLLALGELKLNAADFQRRGLHPALGTVTLQQLLSCWVAHDMSHIHQLSRVMAHQYDKEVGPWKQYMGVLHCKPLE